MCSFNHLLPDEASPSEFLMMPWGIIWQTPDRYNGNGDIALINPKSPYIVFLGQKKEHFHGAISTIFTTFNDGFDLAIFIFQCLYKNMYDIFVQLIQEYRGGASFYSGGKGLIKHVQGDWWLNEVILDPDRYHIPCVNQIWKTGKWLYLKEKSEKVAQNSGKFLLSNIQAICFKESWCNLFQNEPDWHFFSNINAYVTENITIKCIWVTFFSILVLELIWSIKYLDDLWSYYYKIITHKKWSCRSSKLFFLNLGNWIS